MVAEECSGQKSVRADAQLRGRRHGTARGCCIEGTDAAEDAQDDRIECLLRLRLGSDRVREARPVLLVGNFDWIGSASRSLRFTARTAPRLRRRSGATRTGGAAVPPMIESDTSRPTVTSVAARTCRRCRQRRPLSRRRQLRPRSRLAQTTLPGSCDWYARRSSAP